MSKLWKTYLLWFAHEHVDFRLAEIESLISLLKIEMRFVQKPKEEEPFWIVELPSEEEVIMLTSRSVSVKNCLELWSHAKTVETLHQKLKQYPLVSMTSYFQPDKSFKIEVETFCKHFSQNEKIEKLESFSYLPVQGPVNLKNPDVTFHYIEYYGTVPNEPPEQPYDVFFGRWVASGLRQLIKKLSLKTRKFIGNTSMDAQLSLLMANQAKVTNGTIVLDPFVGSGSLLVAAAEFGGYVFGTDIDYLMLHARTKPTRIKQKAREQDESIKANMKQYNLQHKYMDVLVNDFSAPFWRDNVRFEAIITDPPYGIREATEKIGTLKENFTISEKHLSSHLPAKIEYGISSIYSDLMKFSAKHLLLGGRLVCWFPIFRDDYDESKLPAHPCLKLMANSEQVLSKATSRRLLTFEKAEEPNELESTFENNGIMDFRAKYFGLREETRKERRTKEAKIREENRVKYSS